MTKILGINDEVTTCECCGRTNLKKTVILSTGEGEVRYGTACAAKALRRTETAIKNEAANAETIRSRKPVAYYVKNVTLGVVVGGVSGGVINVKYATREEAEARATRAAMGGMSFEVCLLF